MVGAFWFLPILKIGPIPTRATPWISARAEPGTERFGSASGQDVAHVAWVPAATACCRNTTRVERFSEGLFFRRCRRRFTALRLISFRKHRRMHDSNRTAAHGPVKVSRFLPGVWRLVPDSAVPSYFPNHLRDPFCLCEPGCHSPIVFDCFSKQALAHLGVTGAGRSKQPGSRVILEQFCIADVTAQRVDRLVPGLVHHLEDGRTLGCCRSKKP